MRLIDISNIDSQITYWKVESNGEIKYFDRKRCKQPETALKRAKMVFDGEITVSGLLVHAETKPIIIE